MCSFHIALPNLPQKYIINPMKKRSFRQILFLFILAALLAIICTITLSICGKTQTISIDKQDDVSIEDIKVVNEFGNEPSIVKLTGRYESEDSYDFVFSSISPGSELLVFSTDDSGTDIRDTSYLIVQRSGLISRDENLGKIRGDIVIPISIVVFLAFVVGILFYNYRSAVRESIYQPRCIAFLGMAIFAATYLVIHFTTIFDYGGLEHTIRTFISAPETISILSLPVAAIATVTVTASNVVLLIKEGLNIKNLLGLMLGLLICLGAFLPSIIYMLMFNVEGFDIHNLTGFPAYFEMFLENILTSSIIYFECILIATIRCAIRAARHIPAFDKDFIMILGCMIRKDGTLTALLRSRTDKAVEFAKMQKDKTGKDIFFIPSGGKGDDECMAEGRAIADYLISQGIPEDRILVEDKSTNTRENIRFSRNIADAVNPEGKMAFATTNYHVLRAGAYAYLEGIDAEGIGSPTKAYFWANAFIREFIANIVNERKKHFIFLALILLTLFALAMILYIFA